MPHDIRTPLHLPPALPLRGDTAAEHLWLHDVLAGLLAAPPQGRAAVLAGLAARLDQGPDAPAKWVQLRDLWSHWSAARLLAEAGLPEHPHFFHELRSRLTARFLPPADLNEDLYSVLDSLDLECRDAEWLESLSSEVWQRWSPLLAPPPEAIRTAAKVLAFRVAGLGLSRDIVRLSGVPDSHSPFLRLSRNVEAACDCGSSLAWEDCRAECLAAIEACHRGLERGGASTAVTFRITLLASQISRIHDLLRLLKGEPIGRKLAASIVRGFAEQRGIWNLARDCSRRLAQKVIEQSGRAGEDYIAYDRREAFDMGARGFGAGFVTAFTALFKFAITDRIFAPMLVGVGHAVNYTSSFVLMQLCHFPLASKMPAMTAATLAAGLAGRGPERHVQTTAAIVRTQLVVTLANAVATVSTAIVVSRLYAAAAGRPYLDAATASHGIESLHPLASPTMLYAVATGVMLWIASLAGGWTANWMAHRGLASGIRRSLRLRRRLSARRIHGFASFVDRHTPGIAGYVVLGFLLGFLPVLCRLLGIPLEVRHVTLAAASLAYDFDSLLMTGSLPVPAAVWAIAGVVCVGILNLATAFACGFTVALRARPGSAHGAGGLASAAWKELRKGPGRFSIPSREQEEMPGAVTNGASRRSPE